MSDCFIFTTGSGSGALPGEVNLAGTATEAIYGYSEQWSCAVGYRDSIPSMQAKIKTCVALMYLTNFGVVIGGADKVTFVGGFS